MTMPEYESAEAKLPKASHTVRTIRTITALILREMGAKYGRTPGGYAWAILEPVGVIALLSIGFSIMVRKPSMGTSFLLFFATGYLPYVLYSTAAGATSSAMRYSKPLLAYPAVTWLDTIIARWILNFLTSATVFCIIISGIIIITNLKIILDVKPIFLSLLMAALLGLGVGLVNCVLGGLYPVWTKLWAILTRPLLLASGVLYIYEDLPKAAQNILWWNPLLHITGMARSGFYTIYDANFVNLTYCWMIILVLILLGLVFLRANYRRVLEGG
jgi:capsular polysaccharide transport system permease protein